MSKDLGTVWPLEPHTEKKHEILRAYFEAWLPIMAKWNQRILYIDGFAGPGRYSKGEDGSPIIVLKAARDHRSKFQAQFVCLFIEADPARFEELKRTTEELKPTLPQHVRFQCERGDFNEQLGRVFDFLDEQKKAIAPTLLFIDPFGFSNTPFSTVSRVMANNKCEVLVNFMYEEINRFLSHPDHSATFDALFGTRAWRQALEKTMPTPVERLKEIHGLYLKQLKTIAKYVRSFQMLNRGNRTDYFLFFATNALKGMEKFKEAIWRVDKSAGAQFSDYTDGSGQLRLLAEEPDYDRLRQLVTEHYSGKPFGIDELEDWVTAETEFLPRHLRKRVLIPMETDKTLKIVGSTQGRRKGTFPPGTVLRI